MANILFIHGAWGGAWVFDGVARTLNNRGHSAKAIDLPGHGKDTTPIAGVTMEAYVDRVIDEVESLGGDIVLAGHSLAGSVISRVAECIPDRLISLLYICALLPRNGETPIELMKSDAGGKLLPRVEFCGDGSYATISEGVVREVFLHDVEDQERVNELLPRFAVKQATQPFMVPAELSESKFGSVPKSYIRCERDRVISTELQDHMIMNSAVERVVTLDTGHFPLMSAVNRLSGAIDEAIGSVR